MPSSPKYLISLLVIVLAVGDAHVARAQQQDNAAGATVRAGSSGPVSLVIAYRVRPEQRGALRKAMEEGGVDRFNRWQKDGLLKEYRLLFNSYLDSETYDLLSFLSFYDASGIARWKEVEKRTPGGLPAEVLPYLTSATTYSLETVFAGASARAATPGKSAFAVAPYDVLIPVDDYGKYLEAEVVPQIKAALEENALASCSIYLTRYSGGRPWRAVFVFEYRDRRASTARRQ